MNSNNEIKDILLAVDSLLQKGNHKETDFTNTLNKPLILVNEAKSFKKENIPKDTESIILQAERYLKK
tara:strand:+ start:2642 stop:2845 length:204 start_codon:yes stop_codon:yes gene_type:complete